MSSFQLQLQLPLIAYFEFVSSFHVVSVDTAMPPATIYNYM